MRWYDDYYRSNRRMSLMDYLLAHMANMTEDHSDIMASALDEVAPKPKPKTPFKVVSTKTVKRNGKTYRVTVEELSETEDEDSEPVVEAQEADDFDEDMKEDMA